MRPHSEARHFMHAAWSPHPYDPPDTSTWPFTIPAIAQLIEDRGLSIAPGVTFLIGENGSGKSTLVEALAAVYPRRGFVTPFASVAGPKGSGEDSSLAKHLKAQTHKMAAKAGFFLRAEAMHGFLGEVDADPGQARAWGGERMQERSHGESFLAVLRHRFADVGVYFMDEPEAALSFRSCLALVSLLDTLRAEGSQVVVATHSPLLVSLPGATLIELGEHGMREVPSWEDLSLVQDWRQFLREPGRYLRHLLED